jgi:iron complex transport system permease protein
MGGAVPRQAPGGLAHGGAAFVGLADLAARTVASPIEIPVGIITALAGGPLVLWMLVRTGGARL